MQLYLQIDLQMYLLIFIYFMLQVSAKEVTKDEVSHTNVRVCKYKQRYYVVFLGAPYGLYCVQQEL